MDYMTKPISRMGIRNLSKLIRHIFGLTPNEPFPVLRMLDLLCMKFEDTEYEIVEDSVLQANVFACCHQKPDGGFIIQIKQTVYDGAYQNNSRAFLCFICHEICHVILFKLGYTPLTARAIESDIPIPAYRSVEWQAKALCGELTIPFEATIGMTAQEICRLYPVTKQSANYRVKMK